MHHRKIKAPPTSQMKERHTSSRQNVSKKDQNAQRSQLLKLAMDWKCIDVAKELILQNSLDNILVRIFNEEYSIDMFPVQNKEEAFLHALTEDLPAFVYEFLKLGIYPSDIFFPNVEFFSKGNRYAKFIMCLYKDNPMV